MAVLVLGVLLTVIALPVKEEGKEGSQSLSGTPKSASGLGQSASADSTQLETKLAALLENTQGVGRVQVLLMTGQEAQGFYSAGSTEVTGVLIVAEGADNAVTKQNIQQAVMALFQIEAHKIKIMKMK